MSDAEPAGELRRTPLWSRHVAAGARMVPFAGFDMPVVYASILDEHRAVRTRAGLFDVSHMGEVRLRGPAALELAQRLFTNDVAGTGLGRVRYGLFCVENGGVVDDVTLYRTGERELLLCVNASNIAADLAWLREVHAKSGLDCEIVDESDATGLLALQGPEALAIVGAARARGLEAAQALALRARASSPAFRSCSRAPATPARTATRSSRRPSARSRSGTRVREAGGDALALAGLGARDTLRTEMAYPLYGHELDLEHDPIEAGLERFVAFGRGFIGEAALRRHEARGGPARTLVGLVLEGRQVARPGFRIQTPDGDGVVTSGTFGPSVDGAIALGYVPAKFAAGAKLHVEIRGKSVPCKVVSTPFYKRG